MSQKPANPGKVKIEHARFRIDLQKEEAFLSQHGMPEEVRLTPEMEAMLENDESNFTARMKNDLDKESLRRFEETNAKMKEERWARQPFENPSCFRNISPTGWKEMPASMVVWETDNYVAGDPLNVSYNSYSASRKQKTTLKSCFKERSRGINERRRARSGGYNPRVYGAKVENPRITAFLKSKVVSGQYTKEASSGHY